MMDATRRNFLRGMLISLGLSMVPAAAIVKREWKEASYRGVKLLVDPKAPGDGGFIVSIEDHDQIAKEISELSAPCDADGGWIVPSDVAVHMPPKVLIVGPPVEISLGYGRKR